MIKISVLGAAGRMGRQLVRAAIEDPRFQLVGALARHGASDLGKDAGELAGAGISGVSVSDDLALVLANADVAIDFTLPEATLFNIRGCEAAGCALMIGSTGHGPDQQRSLRDREWQIPAVLAPNMSVAVNVLYSLAAMLARALPDYDAEISETHHRHKKDAPSGTALRLGEVVAEARGRAPEEALRAGRGPGDPARAPGEIGISSLRAGEIIGEHRLVLAGPGETLEICHRALDRKSFAHGALQAAAWVKGRPAGLYDMGDVLGLKGTGAAGQIDTPFGPQVQS